MPSTMGIKKKIRGLCHLTISKNIRQYHWNNSKNNMDL